MHTINLGFGKLSLENDRNTFNLPSDSDAIMTTY